MITEFRIYKLKENTRIEFNEVFIKQSLPLLKRWNVDVVDYGFSLIDGDSFYLIRNYKSLEERQQSQDAFYGSDEWIGGPEKSIMNCIDTYNTTIVERDKLSIKKNK